MCCTAVLQERNVREAVRVLAPDIVAVVPKVGIDRVADVRVPGHVDDLAGPDLVRGHAGEAEFAALSKLFI